MTLVIGFTMTTAVTSTFQLWKLRRQRNASRVEIAFQAGMLFVAAPVALLMLTEYFL